MSVLETVIHSTLTKSRKKLIMASVKANVLMAWMFNTKRVDTETGGHDITNPLIVGRNPNVGTYQYYDSLPMSQTDEFDTVTYGWSRFAGSLIISDQEQDENQGETAIFKILTAKMTVLEESISEKFSEYVYGAGTGTDPNGLANLIPDDPTTGVLGGIDRATESQWRTSSYDFDGGLDYQNIEEVFDDVLMDLKVKQERPDIIVAGRDIYRDYRAAVRDKLTINLGELKSGKGMVDLGFAGVSHDSIPIVYDEDCAVNKCYFVNSKYLRLHILKAVNMKVKNLVAPWTVDAIGRRIVWQGQFCVWRAWRTHGVVMN
jgi:hypothetical protein